MKHYLGIDYGRKNIGIALATTPLADPLKVINNDQNTIPAIIKVISDNNIDTIVLGISENQMAIDTKQFAKNLKQKLSIPLVFQDETLSSHLAQKKLLHTKKSSRSKPQDAYQAALMLQGYLDNLD